MIAGVLLGPSLLGRVARRPAPPFPAGPANVVLYTAAQIGLVLYMFLIGLNFDVNLIKHRVGTAVAVSAAGIVTPLLLGALIAAPLLASGTYFDKSVTLVMAMMFLGASIATTAFPMLARIIYERASRNAPGNTRIGVRRDRRRALLVHSGDGARDTSRQRRRRCHRDHRRNPVHVVALDIWAQGLAGVRDGV